MSLGQYPVRPCACSRDAKRRGRGATWGTYFPSSLRAQMSWLTVPATVELQMLDQLARFWWEVSNAGDPVRFPCLPVTEGEVESSAAASHSDSAV